MASSDADYLTKEPLFFTRLFNAAPKTDVNVNLKVTGNKAVHSDYIKMVFIQVLFMMRLFLLCRNVSDA